MDDSRNEETKKTVTNIKDVRVKYFYNQERLGFVENKNYGVRNSSSNSKYIAFLDDDDEYLSEFLFKTISRLESDEKLMAVSTDAELRRQDGSFIKIYKSEDEKLWRVALGNGCVIRKKIFIDEGFWYDGSILFEDLDFGIRVVRRYKYERIPEVLRIYYGYPIQSGDSNTTSYNKNTPANKLEEFLNKNLEIYKDAGGEALGWVNVLTGKMLMRAGYVTEGRAHLKQGFFNDPISTNLIYYLFSLFMPGLFRNMNMLILKNKLKNIIK